MAVQYSEKCYWGHGTVPNISPYDSIGQNLWIRGGTTKQPNPVSGITAWHNEVEYYDFDTNSCLPNKQCGHYTQVSVRDIMRVTPGFVIRQILCDVV